MTFEHDLLLGDKRFKYFIGLMAKINEKDIVAEYFGKFQLMWSARESFHEEWNLVDAQTDANTIIDNQWRLKVNLPIEKSLIEFSVWANSWKVNYTIEPINEASVDVLQPAKYCLDTFLEDDNQMYNFYNEKRKFEYDSCKYWTWFLYTWLTFDREEIFELDESSENIYDNNYTSYKREKWCFIPRNIPLRNIWLDYSAIWQSDFNKVNFCVMQEMALPELLKLRRENIPWFRNIDKITPYVDIFPQYWKIPIRPDEAMIHYYFNRITKDYRIILNRSEVLYAWKLLYKHWRLPFVHRQYYPNTWCIYWEWIPHRIRTDKTYKNVILQSMLDKVQMSAWINIWIGNNWEVDWDLYTAWWEINIWRFNQSVQNVQQFALDSNITPMANTLTLLDDLMIQHSWQNLKAPYSSPAWTLWEAEIMEENKMTRQRTVDEMRDIAIDNALTQVLSNIQQFAPAVLKEIEYVEVDWKKVIKNVKRPKIKVPNSKVEKKWWKLLITEDYWEYWYFEMKQNTIEWDLTVRCTTPNTKSNLKTIEKNSITQAVQNIQLLSTLIQFDPDVAPMIKDRVWWILKRMDLAYWLDNKYTVDTKRDLIRKENEEALKWLQQMIWWFNWLMWQNGQEWQPSGQPTMWWLPQPWPTWMEEQPKSKAVAKATTASGAPWINTLM